MSDPKLCCHDTPCGYHSIPMCPFVNGVVVCEAFGLIMSADTPHHSCPYYYPEAYKAWCAANQASSTDVDDSLADLYA